VNYLYLERLNREKAENPKTGAKKYHLIITWRI